MTIAITQLSHSESVHLLIEALNSYWPDTHFTITNHDDFLALSWTDGPTQESVNVIAGFYQPDFALPDWDNTLVIAHPEGGCEVVLPTLGDLRLERRFSARTIARVAIDLQREGVTVSPNEVAAVLEGRDPSHQAYNAIFALSQQYTPPNWCPVWVYENSSIEDDVMELCDAISLWIHDPENFTQWEVIVRALHDWELSSVLAWALSVNEPYRRMVHALLSDVATRCLATDDLETAVAAEWLVEEVMPVDDGGLFPKPVTKEISCLTEMGDLLCLFAGSDL